MQTRCYWKFSIWCQHQKALKTIRCRTVLIKYSCILTALRLLYIFICICLWPSWSASGPREWSPSAVLPVPSSFLRWAGGLLPYVLGKLIPCAFRPPVQHSTCRFFAQFWHRQILSDPAAASDASGLLLQRFFKVRPTKLWRLILYCQGFYGKSQVLRLAMPCKNWSMLDLCIKIDAYFGFCVCSVVFPVAKLPGELAGL